MFFTLRSFVSLNGLLAATLSVVLALCSGAANSTVLDREKLAAYFPEPLIVGEKDPALPVWPLFRQDRTDKGWDNLAPIGYAFESLDFAPVVGFSGTPINLLIALGPRGEFLDVRVLSQHEPVFVVGLGPEPLNQFVSQYKGLAITQHIKIGSNLNKSGQTDSANVFIDGVAKATASVSIVNQSLLSAALKVARARLGFSADLDPEMVGRIKMGLFTPMESFSALEHADLVTRKVWLNRDIEAKFKDTVGEGQDELARTAPDHVFSEMLVLHLNVPTVGRNVLPEKEWKRLLEWLEPGDHAFLVASRGRYSFVGEDYIAGAVPNRLTLNQSGLPLEMRDFAMEASPKLPVGWDAPSGDEVQWRIFKVISQASLDPAKPLDFSLSVTRQKGQVLPETVQRNFEMKVVLPPDYVSIPTASGKSWHAPWKDRAGEIIALVLGLGLLTVLLARPQWITTSPRRLQLVRNAYLGFTLGFIGWYAQGQLSIVNITAFLQALLAGRSLGFFLFDPITVILWAYVAVSLVLWGRGTFCGWLCPFGALQELMATLARWFQLAQWRPRTGTDATLKWIKYGVLLAVVGTLFLSPEWTDMAVEVEPFKTAITLTFDRSWPYVLWAAGLLALSAFVYKGYCRYLCPLGAGLAVLGRVRGFDWLKRRAECGQPCQTCRHKCQYQAIKPQGSIDYNECFQCLECVAIYNADSLCTPRVLEKRKGKVIPVRPLHAQASPSK